MSDLHRHDVDRGSRFAVELRDELLTPGGQIVARPAPPQAPDVRLRGKADGEAVSRMAGLARGCGGVIAVS